MLSITSKVAALYVQDLDDAVVLSTVSDIQSLATGLSAKIWQKIVILDTLAIRGDTPVLGTRVDPFQEFQSFPAVPNVLNALNLIYAPSARLLLHLIFPLPVLRDLSLLMQLAHGRGDGPIFHLRKLIQ
jgi:hypothetical protein